MPEGKFMKLATAGCVVGLLSSMAVKADYDYTYALAPDSYEVENYDTAYAPEEEDEYDQAAAPEEEAEVPVAEDTTLMAAAAGVVDGTYTQYAGSDYIPAGASPDVTSTLVTVTDIDGVLVDDIVACEAECDAEATGLCNTVSFYSEDSPVYTATGSNCFLKTLGDSCSLPADALTDETATVSLKCVDPIAPLAAAGPATATAVAPLAVAAAAAPVETSFATPPTTTTEAGTTTTAVTDTDADDTTVATGGSCGLYTSMAAVAAAGVVALI